MIYRERMNARLEGDFVVFLIGMRVNQWAKIHCWLPVLRSMGKMLKELEGNPQLGLLHHEAFPFLIVQYWRSMDHLVDYAKNKDAEHLPAWKAFNQKIAREASVGIWHETYLASAGTYENIYVNMPAFGLGKAGALMPVSGKGESASARMARMAEPGS